MFPFNRTIRSASEMENLSAEIGAYLIKNFRNSIILLEGELGAGKTAFCRGLQKPLGIDDNINSPTFNLLNEYTGRFGILYHYDLYRIQSEQEIIETGFIDLWSEKSDMPAIHAIEWWKKAGNLIPDIFPNYLIQINFSDEYDETRTVHGEKL